MNHDQPDKRCGTCRYHAKVNFQSDIEITHAMCMLAYAQNQLLEDFGKKVTKMVLVSLDECCDEWEGITTNPSPPDGDAPCPRRPCRPVGTSGH